MADGRQRRERSKRRDDRGRSRDRRRRRRDDEEEDANRAKLVPARAPSPPPPKHPPRGAAPKGKAREKNEETDDDSEGEESSGGEPDMEVETTVPGNKEAKLAADNDDKAAKANKRSASAVAEDPRLLPEPKGSDGAGDGKRGRSQPAGGAGGSKPPPKAKKSDKLMIKDDSQTDEDRTSSYNCDVCGRYVGGGAAGRYQHLRSPFHLSYQLWQSGKYQTWNAAKQKAHKMSEELWANKDSLYSGPQHGNQGSDKSSKMKQKTAPPVVDRVELDRDRHKKPPDDQDGDGHGPGSGSSLLLQMWQKTVEMLR